MSKPLIFFLLLQPLFIFAITDEEFARIRQAQRTIEVETKKAEVMEFDGEKPKLFQLGNGDEERYPDLRGNFNKGLTHQSSGFANPSAFSSLVKALSTHSNSDFNQIQIGEGVYKLVSPQSSLAFSLAGVDGWINSIPAAPAFASAETAGEMVELYWSALVRDVNFNDFDTDPTVAMAVADLNNLSNFKGPKVNGNVTAATFLRGSTPGDLIGPYISQFLYLDIPYGATTITPEIRVPTSGIINDFMTNFVEWLQVEQGGSPTGSITYDGTAHFIRTPRDLSEYVHQDTPGQAALNALLILLFSPGLGTTALDPANPYVNNPTQDGFVTFGVGQYLALVRNAAQEALKTAWCHKWQINRRLRPEEFGFYLQKQLVDGSTLDIHPDLLNSSALPLINGLYASYFLPQAYPEGSPVHPSYPAGHATFIGAAVTILKAIFNENFIIPSPVEPDNANSSLQPYTGPALTIGNELNKLAFNIALGRDHAGVHYRSDGYWGILLGEKVAIDILNNESFLFNEDFSGYSLTTFEGKRMTIGGKR